jgi:hypothetical protein
MNFVITDDNKYATAGIISESEGKIAYVETTKERATLLSYFINNSVVIDSSEAEPSSKINIVVADVMKEWVILGKYFFDTVFVPLNTTKNIDIFLIINGWDKKNKLTLILRNDSIETSYGIKINKKNTTIHNTKNLSPEINYFEKIFKKGDQKVLFEVVESSKSVDKNTIIVAPSAKDVQFLFYHLTKVLDRNKYYVSTIYIDRNELKFNIRKDESKIIIYIIESELCTRIPFPDISYVYDVFSYSAGGNTFYNSRERAGSYINYINKGGGGCLRYTSKDFFQGTYPYDIPNLTYNSYYYSYLLLIENGQNPFSVFKKFTSEETIRNVYNNLWKLSILNMNQIMIDYKTVFSFGLFLKPSMLIYKASMSKKIPLFPVIVLASIIHNSEVFFYSKKYYGENMLLSYLKEWCVFADEIKNLNIRKDELDKWSFSRGINKNVFANILMDVKRIYELLSPELGIFSPENLLTASKDIMMEVYKEYVYTIENKHAKIYSNGKTPAKLEYYGKDTPDRVISFRRVKGDMDKITFYLPL